VDWITRVSFLQGQEFLCTVVCPHVPLCCVCFGNPPWLEKLRTLVFHVASYQLYKYAAHQLQYSTCLWLYRAKVCALS